MVEDDEDRAIFLGDFNEPDDGVILVTPTSGTPFELPLAIFDERPKQDDPAFRDGAKMSGAMPKLECRSSEFPKTLIGRATVTVRGKNYSVFDVRPDATGMTCVLLKRIVE